MKEESEKAALKLNIQKTKIMASGSIIWWQIDGEPVETVTHFILLGSKITADGDCIHEIKRCLLLGRKAMTNLDSVLKNRHHLADKGLYSESCGFSSSQVWMWELNHKESWALKNWCFELWHWRGLSSPLNCKEIKPIDPKGNQFSIFIGRTDAEAETPILWPPDAKNWLIRKDRMFMKDWRQEKKRMTEDEIIGWHHWLYGLEFEQALGVVEGQGSLACCSPWDHKESDTTEWLNWTCVYVCGATLLQLYPTL